MAQNASFKIWKFSSGTWGHLACVIRGILHNKKYRYVIYSHMKHMEQVSGPYLQYWWSHWPTKLKKQFCPKKCPKRKFGEAKKKESSIKERRIDEMRNQGYTHDAWDIPHPLKLVWAWLEVSKFWVLESEKTTSLTCSCLCKWQYKDWTLGNHIHSLWSRKCDIQDTTSVANNV